MNEHLLKRLAQTVDGLAVNSLTITWMIVAAGGVVFVLMALYTLWSRRSTARARTERGNLWRRAHHLAAEIVSGRHVEENGRRLIELVDDTDQPLLVASALAVLVRQEPADLDGTLFRVVRRSRLPKLLQARMGADDANSVIEALELAEVLRIHDVIGDAAALTRHDDALVVRAAADAVVALEPSAGLGILVGLAGDGESWVLDSVGRAIDAINRRGHDPVPLSAGTWRDAPMLATRALNESATFDRATVSDAVGALIACLDDASSPKRLAAVKALSACADNPAAQLALAGALGSPDRMTRYAVAAALSDSVSGRQILRSAAAERDGSDAARMAAEILWLSDEPLIASAGQ